jgi:ankyrin repeat protein
MVKLMVQLTINIDGQIDRSSFFKLNSSIAHTPMEAHGPPLPPLRALPIRPKLWLECYLGHRVDVKDLLDLGEDIEEQGELTMGCWYTPLGIALYYRDTDMMKVLLERHADHAFVRQSLYGRGRTMLHEAVRDGDEAAVRVLLRYAADVSAKDHEGTTPLMQAATEYGGEELILLLLQHGADVSATNQDGDTPLMGAVRRGFDATADLLITHGANVSARNHEGTTPLMKAAKQGGEESILLLLQHGADVSATDQNGDTPLMGAVRRGLDATADLLITHGANVSARNHFGKTPMSIAAHQGHAVVVALLVEKNADVNAVDNHGYTAMHQAAREGHCNVVRLLLHHGANVLARTDFGCTAETLAEEGAYHAVAGLLKAVTLSNAKCVAFAMGHHERLRVGSMVVRLDPEVLRMVLGMVLQDVNEDV